MWTFFSWQDGFVCFVLAPCLANKPQSSESKGERDNVCVHSAWMWLSTGSVGSCWPLAERGALMSIVPWNQPTPHVQGDWHYPVPWQAALYLWCIDWGLGKKKGSILSNTTLFFSFFQKHVQWKLKLSFNHFAKVLSSPITCKAIVLLANSSSGAFIQTPPRFLMLMISHTGFFLMILRKCSPLLSPSYRYLPCAHFFFIYLIHPLVFKGPINEMCPQQFSCTLRPYPLRFAYLLSAVVICRLPPAASKWMSRTPRGCR